MYEVPQDVRQDQSMYPYWVGYDTIGWTTYFIW
jgi:hypothetical protein